MTPQGWDDALEILARGSADPTDPSDFHYQAAAEPAGGSIDRGVGRPDVAFVGERDRGTR